MSKKTKQAKKLQTNFIPSVLVQKQISHARHKILQGDFNDTINICEPLLGFLPRRSSLRVEVLALLGLSHGMLQHYEESYKLFTEALTLDPLNAELWYNHGLACRYTTRLGQSMLDFERAVELTRKDPSELARKFITELEKSRKDLEEAMQKQGESITLDQFIEREELFMQAMDLMQQTKWKEAEQAFRHLIEIGGRLPQYWGNLGVSLIMQTRYEEAEEALKRAIDIDPEYTLARNNLEKIPQVRRAGGPLGIELRDLSYRQDIKQSITFYQQNKGNSSPSAHTTIEQIGNTVKGTRKPIGKQPPTLPFLSQPLSG